MKKLIIIIILFPTICNAEMFDDWTTQDWVLQWILSGLIIIDYFQTSEFVSKEEIIEKNGKRYKRTYTEDNVVLGDKPSQDRINLMIGAAFILNWIIADYLDHQERTSFQMTLIIFETSATRKNYNNGIRISYYF